MEASDVTGELRLCMQVIATAGMEQTRYGTNLLERENRFKELMQMFDRLDQIVYRYRNGLQKKEDAVFLKEQGITDTALLIALRMMQRARRNCLHRLRQTKKHWMAPPQIPLLCEFTQFSEKLLG